MQVEYVSRISLAARRSVEQQRERSVCNGVLRKIVIYDQYVFALVHEVLGHRAARVRRNVLKRSRVARRSGDYDGVVHRAVLLESLLYLYH